MSDRALGRLLLALTGFDLALTVWAGFFPTLWFEAFHGVGYFDPEGFLRRMAANWAAFALFQGVAWRRWRAQPFWLAVVAGMRLGDMLTDWTYLFFARDRTWFAWLALLTTSPANAWLGWRLLAEHHARTRRS